jgi:DNA-binding PadR family transcriptional regulator
MDWTEETLRSPYDPNAKEPEDTSAIYQELNKLQEDSYIEFYEMV